MIQADKFKSIEWKNRIRLLETNSENTIGINSAFFCLVELLRLFERNGWGQPISIQIQDYFDIFVDQKSAEETIEFVLKSTNVNYNINDNVNLRNDLYSPLKSWDAIKNKVISEYRFLTNLDTEDEAWDKFLCSNHIILKGSSFFRGRLNEKKSSIYPKEQMGMPPMALAKSNRANPPGIPYLYLTEKEETIMYELRASHGDEISVGSFITKNDLNVVDFNQKPSILDAIDRFDIDSEIKGFLLRECIADELSKPMHRYNNADVEYVPTQYICEFIKKLGADGIMFQSSVHKEGKNLVLFSDVNVECVDVVTKVVGEPQMMFDHTLSKYGNKLPTLKREFT